MKKKIIHIITRLDTGGSSENVILTCARLNPEKFESILLYGKSSLTGKTFPFQAVEIPAMLRAISPVNDIKAFLSICRYIKKIRPDIVHTHSSKAGFIGRLAAKLSGVKTIIHTPHGHVFYGYGFGALKTKLYIFIEKLSAKITSNIIALTAGERDESMTLGIGKKEQWDIIHSGVDTANIEFGKLRAEIRKQFNIPENAIVIGTVARLEPVKGVQYLIEAAAFIKLPLYFLIVGDGNQRRQLESTAKNLGLTSVIFTGMRGDAPQLMAAMDIYVQPSLNEGMGKTIVQAQCAGLAVIATRVQGIPDLINDGQTGILVPPKDPRSLAAAIEQLASNKPLRSKLGLAAAKYAGEIIDGYPRYSSQRMIYMLEKLYG